MRVTAATARNDCALAAAAGWIIYPGAPTTPTLTMLELTVPPQASGHRLDLFLAGELAHLSRARVQALIRGGHVCLNRRTVSKPAEAVHASDVVTCDEPPVAETTLIPEARALSVLYEDEDLIVLDKSAGMVTHPAPGKDAGTLVNALLAHCPTLSGIGGEHRPGIVHRLDKETSGCLVVAKNDFTHRALAIQFAARTTEKHYLALVRGLPRPASGTIDAPVGRHPVHRKKMTVLALPHGRAARTDYRVRKTFTWRKTVADESNISTRPYITVATPLTTRNVTGDEVISLVECCLHTGRTHQIRVHLKHLGYPILGDALYGGPRPPGRQMLHAWKLGFTHPRTGERVHFRAPLPADFLAYGLDPHDP